MLAILQLNPESKLITRPRRGGWGEGNVDRDLSLTLRDFVGLKPSDFPPRLRRAFQNIWSEATKSPSPEERGWGEGNVDRDLSLTRSERSSALSAASEAESEGFEPPVPFSTTVFKTAAIDHSANSPKGNAKILIFFKVHNFSSLS